MKKNIIKNSFQEIGYNYEDVKNKINTLSERKKLIKEIKNKRNYIEKEIQDVYNYLRLYNKYHEQRN